MSAKIYRRRMMNKLYNCFGELPEIMCVGNLTILKNCQVAPLLQKIPVSVFYVLLQPII
jgi:hypothetical protein